MAKAKSVAVWHGDLQFDMVKHAKARMPSVADPSGASMNVVKMPKIPEAWNMCKLPDLEC